MKNIEFRGKSNGHWVYGYFYEECGNTYIIDNRNKADMLQRNVSHKIDPDTVGQFTGLYDADGAKIYENDIVETPMTLCVVAWNSDTSSFVLLDISTKLMGCTPLGEFTDYYEFTVVGNIFDNPERMEGGEQ